MKKKIVLLLTFVMLVLLVSCEQSPSETTSSLQDETTTETLSSSETTTPQETTTEQAVTPPASYRPSLFPSELFDIAKDNPDYDPQYEEELQKQFLTVAPGEILIDKNILAQDDDALLVVCVASQMRTAYELGAYFMHREYETWEYGGGKYNGSAKYTGVCYVVMTKKEIENFKGPEDWSFLFLWHPKEYRIDKKSNSIILIELEDIPEDQKLYVEIFPYCEFSTLNRFHTLCEYYGIMGFPETEEQLALLYEIKEIFVAHNRALVEDCGLSEIVEEQRVSLNMNDAIGIYLTKEQIDMVIASDLWDVIRIHKNDGIPIPTV